MPKGLARRNRTERLPLMVTDGGGLVPYLLVVSGDLPPTRPGSKAITRPKNSRLRSPMHRWRPTGDLDGVETRRGHPRCPRIAVNAANGPPMENLHRRGDASVSVQTAPRAVSIGTATSVGLGVVPCPIGHCPADASKNRTGDIVGFSRWMSHPRGRSPRRCPARQPGGRPRATG